jgi:two-component system OmpR family sensor kinase
VSLGDIPQRYRQRWERTPLRVRLTSAVLILVTGALVLTSVANVTSLQGYMTEQVDSDLVSRVESGDLNQAMELSFDGNDIIASNYLIIVGHEGEIEALNYPPSPQAAPALDFSDLAHHNDEPFTTSSLDGKLRWRVLSHRTEEEMNNGRTTYFALATPLSDLDAAVARLIWIDLLVGAGVLAGLAAIGVALVRASLYPLKEMEHTATSIAAGDLSQRVPERDPRTEVGRLGRTFNMMLGHIQSALAAREASEERALASEDRMRRFVADASHELRTPLTTVRGFAELYRQRGDVDPDEAGQLMRRIEDEATRMGLLVEDLLLLARLDQERPFQSRQVDLLSVAVDIVSATQITAEGHHIELSTQGGPFMVRGDDMRLRQVLSNLVTNAVRHTPKGANVTVRLSSEKSDVELEVADDGPGMTAEQAERVFERFYRADKARSRSAGGTGLGLAIVAALVAAHDGTVAVRSAPGEGAVFTVRLALDPDVRADDDADSITAEHS